MGNGEEMRSVNQSLESLIKGLEDLVSHSPEFQRLQPSELLKTVGYELWNNCVEQSKKRSYHTSENESKTQLARGLFTC